MNFWEIILGLLGGGAVAGIVTLYNAKANNTSIQADTFKKFFDEVQEWSKNEIKQYADEVKSLKEERADWVEKFDKYKLDTAKKFEEMHNMVSIKNCAINSAYRCTWVDDLHNCPVVKTLDELEREREKEEGK